MIIEDICYLLKEDRTPRGVHQKPTVTERMVYCQVRSVGRSEFYQANLAGMSPEYVLKLSDMVEYQGEMTLWFHDEKWKIIRHYTTPDGGVELTIQRSVANAEND